MTTDVATVTPGASVRAIADLTIECRISGVPVVDTAGQLVGIVTDGDLRRAMGPDLLDRCAGEIMTPRPRTIGPDALAVEALRRMNEGPRPITTLFVVDEFAASGKPAACPLGILHIHDLLRAGVA